MCTASDISVVIPSFNSRQTIEACLASLAAQDAAPLEVIVVDSSGDDTAHIIARRFPDVRVHHAEHRIFPGPARNLGVSLARGAIVAFIDADCIAAPDWVRRMAANHAQGRLIVGGAIGVGNPDCMVAWAGHLSEFREYLPLGPARPVMHVPTCNISYRKAVFDENGGFPNAYYPQEDLLFNYMLTRKGLEVWFDPTIRIQHFCREGLREYLSHQHRFGRVTLCTLRKIDLPGSGIARRSWLAWLVAPALGALKFLRTSQVFLHAFPREAAQRPGILVLLALGMVCWARGFASGAQTGLKGIHGWTDPDEPIFERIALAGSKVAPVNNGNLHS